MTPNTPIRLTRLQVANPESQNRGVLVGNAPGPLTIGQPFTAIGDPIDPAYMFRVITTSPVREIRPRGTDFLFVTESGSEYLLELIASQN